MGDSENAHPPSKKRGALKELSRDNPGLDDGSDDDTSAFQSGTFKTASEEVLLATRRIVRDPSSPQQPSSNPFATAPGTVTNKPLSGSNATPDDEGKQGTEDDGRSSDAPKEVIDGGKTKDEAITVTEVEDAAGEETQKAKDDKESGCGVDQTEKEGTDDNGRNSGAFKSFDQYSTIKNAFTVLKALGASISFGSSVSGSVSLTQPPSFLFNGGYPIFHTSGSASITTAFPSKEEVSVETGEENEETVFTAAGSVMFEYLQGGWKKRGKGEVKVNVSITGSRRARVLMRSTKGNYRLILNASLYPEMKLASMGQNALAFACVNSVSEEAKSGLSLFAVRFKDPAIVEEFREAVEEHKGSKPVSVKAAAPLKTPENTPEG